MSPYPPCPIRRFTLYELICLFGANSGRADMKGDLISDWTVSDFTLFSEPCDLDEKPMFGHSTSTQAALSFHIEITSIAYNQINHKYNANTFLSGDMIWNHTCDLIIMLIKLLYQGSIYLNWRWNFNHGKVAIPFRFSPLMGSRVNWFHSF